MCGRWSYLQRPFHYCLAKRAGLASRVAKRAGLAYWLAESDKNWCFVEKIDRLIEKMQGVGK